MAKVLFGVTAVDARGKTGSCVFTRTHAGAVVRMGGPPRNPNTPAQQAVRGNLHSLAKAWSDTLDPTQRGLWIALAGSYPKTDVFTQTYYQTGLQLFIALNQSLKHIGLGPILDAPGSLSAGNPLAVTIAWTSPNGPLTVDTTGNPGTHDVPVIFATAMLRAGRAKVSACKRALDYFPANTPGPWDITNDYIDKHGAFILNRCITIFVKFSNDETGYQGPPAWAQQFLF